MFRAIKSIPPVACIAAASCSWLSPSQPPPPTDAEQQAAYDEFVAQKQAEQAEAQRPEFDCPEGMVYVPGSTAPQVAPFCIDRTEVTVAQYAACVQAGTCSDIPLTGTKDEDGDGKNDFTSGQVELWEQWCNGAKQDERSNHPMNCVFWADAVAYCKQADRALPTETHWLWAANGAKASPFSKYAWGDDSPGPEDACWSGGGTMRQSTCPVGSVPHDATKQGALDMTGNVPEWTSTPMDIAGNPADDGPRRIVHGGGWTAMDPGFMHIGKRKGGPGPVLSEFEGTTVVKTDRRNLDIRGVALNEDGRCSGIGFRCVWVPER